MILVEILTVKEITEAAMVDSIDLAYYRVSGEVKIIQEKFVEVFTRRFAESSTLSAKGYEIEFYDIIEMPPKVTVRVKATTQEYMLSQGSKDSFDIVNELSGILELYR